MAEGGGLLIIILSASFLSTYTSEVFRFNFAIMICYLKKTKF
jgi:hypothetical protein